MELSQLGLFHTVIGVVAIGAAVVSLIQSARIDLGRWAGKVYLYGTLVTSVTALGLSSVKGFNPGHGLAALIIALVVIAYYFYAKKPGNNRFRYAENFMLTFSLLLSLIPTVNETLTRVPVGHPLAAGPTDPLILKTLLLLVVLFIAGSALQFGMQRKMNRPRRCTASNPIRDGQNSC